MLQKIISKTAVIYFVVLLLIKVLNLYRILLNKNKKSEVFQLEHTSVLQTNLSRNNLTVHV